MSIVSNPITNLAPPPPIFGNSIEDTITADNAASFEEILQKQFSIRNENALQSPSGFYGMPSVQDIQNIEQEFGDVENSINAIRNDDAKFLNSQTYDEHQDNGLNMKVAMPDLEVNLGQDFHSQLFKFAKKHAANFYEKCAGNVIVNLDEFVSDTLKLS